jgi:DNA-binding MarR family transcriptional regulator
MKQNLHSSLNPVIHQPIRLQIMTYLQFARKSNFSELKKELGITDGNLGAHLQKLDDNDLVKIDKKIIDKKPLSTINITKNGETQLLNYLNILSSIIEKK